MVEVVDKPDPPGTLYPVRVWDYTGSIIPHTFLETPIRTRGFYPNASWRYAAIALTCPGGTRDDSRHPRNASPTRTYWVNADTLLRLDQGMDWDPGIYSLNNGFWSNAAWNCTGWVNRVIKNANIDSNYDGAGANPWTN